MTVSEILYEAEMRRPQQKGDYAGGMTEGDLDEIRAEAAEHRRWLAEMRAKKDVSTAA